MDDLILIALSDEAPTLAKLPNVFQTGVGKVNAGIAAAKLIERYRPRRVWNFGSAGGITVGSGLHRCSRFIQRDMIVTALGFAPGQTPFEKDIQLDFGHPGLICSSGDSFVTSSDLAIPADLVDMEAYALAKACKTTNTEFHCYKFISDQANETSDHDWRTNLHLGEPLYMDLLNSFHVI
ncbi:MAG: 5'-methylthioadenosine/S-adenosylhomocysteine nucleosidase [Verrucomicrobiota bacterium]